MMKNTDSLKTFFLTLTLFLVTALSGCASIPSICRSGYARQAGNTQASRGEAYNPGQGAVCKDEYRQEFLENFQMGYQEGKNVFCDPSNVAKRATGHGEAGMDAQYSQSAYAICENSADIKTAYERAYRNGLSQFCSPEKASELGLAYGTQGRSPEYDATSVAKCGASQVGTLKQAYQNAYKQGLSQFCQGDAARQTGIEDGNTGLSQRSVLESFGLCSSSQKSAITRQYEQGYVEGLKSFCSETNIVAAAGSNAESSASVSYPDNQNICFSKFPALKQVYAEAFGTQREQIIQRDCSFEKGSSIGRADASQSNSKNTSMPTFCNQALYPIYLNGYTDGWHSEKRLLCSSAKAYQKGMEEGGFYSSTMSQPPRLCPPDLALEWQQQYQAGFRAAKAHQQPPASIVIIPSPHKPHHQGHGHHGHGGHKQARQARKACEARGYSNLRCRKVNSLACINRGYSPSSCSFNTAHLRAVNYCIDAGHSPSSCARVTSLQCLKKGYSPGSCSHIVMIPSAFDYCLDKGYRPASCLKANSRVCLEKGFSPSSCEFNSHYISAIEACLSRGFSPTRCQSVKSRSCIQSGKSPSRCS